MKKLFYISIFLLTTAFAWHKYYVSVTEVYLKTGKLEVIIRTFPDDMENALKDDYHINPDFSKKETQQYLLKYLKRKFIIFVDDTEISYQYLGSTLQDGFLVLLLELPVNDDYKSIAIKNTLLMDMFDEQKNIIHFLPQNSQKESYILTKQNFIARYDKK
jgi:hypothetical protein